MLSFIGFKNTYIIFLNIILCTSKSQFFYMVWNQKIIYIKIIHFARLYYRSFDRRFFFFDLDFRTNIAIKKLFDDLLGQIFFNLYVRSYTMCFLYKLIVRTYSSTLVGIVITLRELYKMSTRKLYSKNLHVNYLANSKLYLNTRKSITTYY